MKKLLTLLTLLLCMVVGVNAESGTEKATNTGTKDTDLTGTSYTISGTYIAGQGGATATGMANKGVKFRTGNDGAKLVFSVNTDYTITDFKLYGVSNYALKDGASEPCIAVTKVEVDGVETTFAGTGNFPAKGSSTAGSVLLSGITATKSIAIYFDNSNAGGTQVNGYYEITWSLPDAQEPMATTVTPTSAYVAVGKTIALTGSFTGGSFEGEWVSDNENVATVSSTGVVTGVSEGTANITYQWAADQSKDAYKATATVTVIEAFDVDALSAVKTYDFAHWGATTLTIGDEAGKIWNQANSVNNKVYYCTNEGLTDLAIQAVLSDNRGWSINDNGLYEGSGAGRCAAIAGIKAGQYVEFNHNSETSFYTKSDNSDDGILKVAVIEEKNHHVYYALEDGMIGFELAKGHFITSIAIYEKKSGTPTTLSFSHATATATLGESFTAPTLTVDPANLTGIVYSSSNTAVATVDAQTGEVTLQGGGTTTITATFEGTDEYWGATASYELTVIDPTATGYNNEAVTITWAFDTGEIGQTATIGYATAQEELFKSATVSIGSNLAYNGTQALNGSYDGLTSTKIKQNDAGSATQQKNAIKFVISPKAGIEFTPTKVKFLATRCGTDGGKMEIAWIDSENTTIALGSAAASKTSDDPARDNNATQNATLYSYDLTAKGAKTTTGDCGLQIITYNANGKSYAFGQIVIEGTLSGSVSAVNTYTITAVVGTDGAGSVSPEQSTVEEGDNLTITATANTGYVFQNWTKESDGSTLTANPLSLTNIEADETYTANYKQLFAINYDTSGDDILKGTVDNILLTEYADKDDKFVAPKNYYLYKEGYTFTGWTNLAAIYEAGNEYTLESDITLKPMFEQNMTSLDEALAETTVTWNFSNKVASFNMEGKTGYFVAQASVNDATIDVPMLIDVTEGKLNNLNRNDEWAQANDGTKLTIPAINKMKVVLKGYKQFTNTTIAGATDYEATTASPFTATYTYTGTDETIDIVIGNDISYLGSVTVTYPNSREPVGITFTANGDATSVERGETLQTSVGLVANDQENYTLSYSSSDEAVATIDDNGVITGVKKGTATMTVTVTASDAAVYAGNTATLNITVTDATISTATVTWDFTQWSQATVDNLIADAAASSTEGWSDIEKKDGTEPSEASKDNCFWLTDANGGTLTANGETITELLGIDFNSTMTNSRGLAIAVNYGSTNLGTYAGPSYLWLGSNGSDAFTLHNVVVGSTIKMTVESHKIAEGRGVSLTAAGTALKDNEGNTASKPTTQKEFTWVVTGSGDYVDVVVKATKGCHVYNITADVMAQKTTVGNAGWATMVAGENALNLSKVEGLEAYTAKLADGLVKLTKVTDVREGTGLVLHGDAGSYDIPVLFWSTTDKGELMGSATEATVMQDGYTYYGLSMNNSGEAQFKKVSQGTIAAGKAFLMIETTANARDILAISDAESTGIAEVRTARKDSDHRIYNLSGQRISKPGKGLYIQNGRKYVK